MAFGNMTFDQKIDLLFTLGQLRNWHPKDVSRVRCGEYYMTGHKKLDGKILTINIGAICKYRGIPLNPIEDRCDQLYVILIKNLQYKFNETEIKICDNEFKVLRTYYI